MANEWAIVQQDLRKPKNLKGLEGAYDRRSGVPRQIDILYVWN